jgi:peptidoglycan-associated lipoprotein
MLLIAPLVAAIVTPQAATQREPERLSGQGIGEVFFAFDSARLPEGASDELARMAEVAKQNPRAKIVVDGHADPRGTGPYNVGLALRRAQTVQRELISRGVDADRVLLVTYGEDGLRRSSFKFDRRATVWATEEPLHAVVDGSLVRGTAILWDEPVTAAEIDGPPQTDIVVTR